MNVLKQIGKVALWISRKLSMLGGYIAGFSVLIVMLIVFLGVFFRYVLASPFTWVEEITGYLVLISVFMGLGYTLRTGGHINTDVLTQFASFDLERYIYVVHAILAFLWSIILGYAFYHLFVRHYMHGTQSNTGLQTPLWMPSVFMVVGCFILVIEFAAWYVELYVLEDEEALETAKPSRLAEAELIEPDTDE